MSQQDAFERVVASFHEATLDDSLWNRTSALIDEACRSMGNQVIFRNDSPGRNGVLFARFCLRGERHKEAELEYYSRFFATDEHVPRLWQLPDSQIVHVTDLFTKLELKTSPTYNEGMARSHNQNALKVRLDGPDNSRIFWSIGDPVDTDGWSSAQTEMIARLLPHLRQFVRVRHALEQAEALGQSLAALLDNNRAGVIQLDRGRLDDGDAVERDHSAGVARESSGKAGDGFSSAARGRVRAHRGSAAKGPCQSGTGGGDAWPHPHGKRSGGDVGRRPDRSADCQGQRARNEHHPVARVEHLRQAQGNPPARDRKDGAVAPRPTEVGAETLDRILHE